MIQTWSEMKEECNGCHACYSVCPNGSIAMKPDREGFLFPSVNTDTCISCAKCLKTCPCIQDIGTRNQLITSEYGFNRNEEIRKKSSSGGIFWAVAESILRRDGYVCGAVYEDAFVVKHKLISNRDDLQALVQSKYVQSNLGDIFKQSKMILERGAFLLFVGTPCQIAGLYAFLDKEYDTLITMDFICHGVPSPLVWKNYTDQVQQKYGKKITGISMRDKTHGWKRFTFSMTFEDGGTVQTPASENIYMQLFLKDIILRKSCYQCHFKGIERQSDITVADLWGSEYLVEEKLREDDHGISLILTHTARGQAAISDVRDSLYLSSVAVSKVSEHNPSMICSVKRNPVREKFFCDLNKRSIVWLHKKYCTPGLKRRLKNMIKRVVRKK